MASYKIRRSNQIFKQSLVDMLCVWPHTKLVKPAFREYYKVRLLPCATGSFNYLWFHTLPNRNFGTDCFEKLALFPSTAWAAYSRDQQPLMLNVRFEHASHNLVDWRALLPKAPRELQDVPRKLQGEPRRLTVGHASSSSRPNNYTHDYIYGYM